MSDKPKIYGFCDTGCKWEVPHKEELNLLRSTMLTINGVDLRFFCERKPEYDALTADVKENLLAVITDDKTREEITAEITDLYNSLINGDTTVKQADEAAHAVRADNATYAFNANQAEYAGKAIAQAVRREISSPPSIVYSSPALIYTSSADWKNGLLLLELRGTKPLDNGSYDVKFLHKIVRITDSDKRILVSVDFCFGSSGAIEVRVWNNQVTVWGVKAIGDASCNMYVDAVTYIPMEIS